MSKLVSFLGNRQLREDACMWLVSIDEGLEPEERTRFTEWLEADPAHLQTLIECARHWDEQSVLSELSELFPLGQTGRQGSRWSRTGAVATAALVVIAIGVAWFVIPGSGGSGLPNIPVALPVPGFDTTASGYSGGDSEQIRDYETAVGEQFSIRLSDGSVATLNTDTAVEVRYTAGERLILLKRGEASFNVARDPQRPLRVRVGTRLIQALGTVFNVQLGPSDGVELTVSEGRVRVMDVPAPDSRTSLEDDGGDEELPEVTLSAGEIAVIDSAGTSVRAIDRVEIEARLLWHQGFLVFRGDPLESVIADVNRYTTTTFVIADDSIRNVRVGGYFRAGDIDGLLLALEESFGVETEQVGDDVVLLTAR